MNHSIVHSPDTLMPYIVGAIFGIIGLFASGFLKEFFDERARIATHKRNVARHVLQICIEASTGNFQQPPRNMEDIYSALTDLEGIDKDAENIMNNFVNLWGRITEIKNKSNHSGDDDKFYVKLNKEIEEKRKILIEWANKIRVGESGAILPLACLSNVKELEHITN